MTTLDLCVLHVVARIALRCQSPRGAKRTVDVCARLIHAVRPRQATDLDRAEALEGRGTCLSRALTIAACLEDADVVVGVDPRAAVPLYAHAWVEQHGVPLREGDVRGHEIARMRRTRLDRIFSRAC